MLRKPGSFLEPFCADNSVSEVLQGGGASAGALRWLFSAYRSSAQLSMILPRETWRDGEYLSIHLADAEEIRMQKDRAIEGVLSGYRYGIVTRA